VNATVRSVAAIIGLVALAFVARYYLLAPETGDIDEATFVVVAQSVLRGALPYETALDNKPAGFFYVLAGAMALFGRNVEVVRLFGSALVAGAALVLWILGRRYLSIVMATALAALFVMAQAGAIGDSTKSELVANLFVSASLLALVSLPGRNRDSFIAGLLIGCAVLSRTNLAYLALAVTLLHLAAVVRPDVVGLKRSGILALAAGGLLPLGLLVLPYALRGELQLLWIGVVEVAWSQAQGSRDAFERLILLPHSFVRILPSLAGLLLVVCGIGIWRTRAVLRERPELWRDVLLGWVYLVAIEFSVVMSGPFYNHYMLQVLPPLVLLGAIGFSGYEWSWRNWTPRLLAAGVGGGLLWFGALGVMTVWQQATGRLERPLRQAAVAMAPELGAKDRVWATGSTQLIYYYLDRDPILPVAVFPSNLTKAVIVAPLVRAGLMPNDGPHAALELRPRFVVTTSAEPPRQLSEADRQRFAEAYELWHSDGGVFVYRLSEELGYGDGFRP